MKSVGPRLVPFLKTAAAFFILYPEKVPGGLVYLAFKLAPVCCLIGFVLSLGVARGNIFAYNRRITLGLLLSALGDAALVFEDGFLAGVASFAAAQLCYTLAFGMQPPSRRLGCFMAAAGSLIYACIIPSVHGLSLRCIGLLYTCLIFTMLWRASARLNSGAWTSVSALLGAVLFVASDLSLVIDKFLVPLPAAHAFVMATYYLAQLGIALSCVDSHIRHTGELSLAHQQ
uniref:lysoplasmalogenase n=1 Tax=Macrostomum lignano TaxID=282301 RepID=A0A1I8FVA9_9PLAT